MKKQNLGLIFLLFGLFAYADSNDLLKFKLESEYDDKYNEIGTSISISAKDDVVIKDIIINRKKCGLIENKMALMMAIGFQALDQALDQALQFYGANIYEEEHKPKEEHKPMKHIKMEFGDTITIYTACKYDKILEIKIETDKGEFVIDEFGLSF